MATEVKAPSTGPAPIDTGYIAKLGGKVRKFKEQLAQVTAKNEEQAKLLEQILNENEQLKIRADTSASAKEVERLTSELRNRDHRKVFDRLATDLKARPEALDDLWKLSGYTPEADTVDEQALKALISKQTKTRAYLFDGTHTSSTDPAGKPVSGKTEPGPGNSRGGLVRDSGKFLVRRRGPDSVRDPAWMQMNQKAYSDAIKAGNVEYLD